MVLRVLALFLFSVNIVAQQKRVIDSINSLPFELMIANAGIYEPIMLKNAADAKKIKYHAGLARSYSNLSLIYYYRGKYEQNIKYRFEAIALYEKLNMTEQLSEQYGELGYSMKRRNMPNAQKYMQKGIRLAERDKFPKQLLKLYDNYGVIKEMQGQLDSALHFYRRGLKIKERLKDSIGIPYSLSNIAGIYVMRKDFEQATPLYERALAIRTRKNDQLGIAENLIYFGDMHQAKLDFTEAIRFYDDALAISVRHNYLFGIQTCHSKLASCYEKLNRQARALEHFKLSSQYKDSIINRETNSRIAEMEVLFDTNEKERKLIEKQADIDQRNMLLLVLGLALAFIAVTGYLIYRQQILRNRQLAQEHEHKNALAQIETQNKLQDQRLAISRDLHDNIGAQLTFIISSVDNTRYAFSTDNTIIGQKLQSIGDFARETIVELRDTIWAMNTNEITFEDLQTRIVNFLNKVNIAGSAAEVSFSIDNSLTSVTLSSIQGMYLYRTIQEAVNNALKYAGASKISVNIKPVDDTIMISVSDDGSGFNPEKITEGNGMANMRKRITEIGGTINIMSEPERGTEIKIHIKNPQA